ncbi:unnamed protein product [Ixodes pacificus]
MHVVYYILGGFSAYAARQTPSRALDRGKLQSRDTRLAPRTSCPTLAPAGQPRHDPTPNTIFLSLGRSSHTSHKGHNVRWEHDDRTMCDETRPVCSKHVCFMRMYA